MNLLVFSLFRCLKSGALALLLALICVQARAEDFAMKGNYADWVLACPNASTTRAIPRMASRGNCERIKHALDNGAAPGNAWEAMAPVVGLAVMDAIDPIHTFLKDLGFREPNLFETSPLKKPEYRVTVAPQTVVDGEKPDDSSFGFYARGFIYIGIESHLEQGGRVNFVELLTTVAHEYFHAIQAAYIELRSHGGSETSDAENDQPRKKNNDGWLIEGTAEFFAQHYTARANGNAYDWKDQPFDFSTSLLKHEDGGYDHHIFFAMLARIINGRGTDEPGLAGFGVSTTSPAYLEKTFSGYQEGSDDLTPDKKAMKWFAAAIPDADPKGRSFQELYALVMRDLTYKPDFIGSYFPYMPGAVFQPELISLRGKVGPGWTQTSDMIKIEPIATKFYRIDATSFPEPGYLGVEIILPEESTTDPADLHLSIHGVSYSKPEWPAYHNFGEIKKGDDEVYLSVSNIAATEYDTEPASFQFRLSWLSGGVCDYETIYSSTRIDEQKNAARNIGVPLDFYDAFYPPPSAFLEEYGTRRRDNSLAGDPAVLPDTGRLVVRGGSFALGGEACTHHAASSALMEAGILGDSMGFSAETEAAQMAEDLRYIGSGSERLANTTKTEEIKRLLKIFRTVTAGTPLGSDPRDASVVFSVFSPDLFAFYHGTPAVLEGGPLIAGQGGWEPNSSGAVNIILPGIKLRDLKAGRSYPAITLAPEGGATDGMPIAGVWRGRWSDLGPIGEFRSLSAARLTGVVKITDITSAQVKGTFLLRGVGSDSSYKMVLEQTDTGPVRLEEDQRAETVPVSVSGSFSSPTAVTGTLIFKHFFGLRSVSRRKEIE